MFGAAAVGLMQAVEGIQHKRQFLAGIDGQSCLLVVGASAKVDRLLIFTYHTQTFQISHSCTLKR